MPRASLQIAFALVCSAILLNSTSMSSEIQRKQIAKTALTVELRESQSSSTFAVIGLTNLDQMRGLSDDQLQKLLVVRVQTSALGKEVPSLLGFIKLRMPSCSL